MTAEKSLPVKADLNMKKTGLMFMKTALQTESL
jgi:hypothetical protein